MGKNWALLTLIAFLFSMLITLKWSFLGFVDQSHFRSLFLEIYFLLVINPLQEGVLWLIEIRLLVQILLFYF